MNPGVSSDGVFLVKCADCKCLATRGANGRWKSFYDDAELPADAAPIIAIPIELVLPFLPAGKRPQMCPVPVRVKNNSPS